MLRTLHLGSQDLEKLQNMELLCIKKKREFDKVVHDNAYYGRNVIEENNDFASLVNVTPFKENMNWPFTSTSTFQDLLIDSYEPQKFDDYFDVVKQMEITIDTSLDLVEQDEVVVDAITYYFLNSNGERYHKIFQQMKDFKNSSVIGFCGSLKGC